MHVIIKAVGNPIQFLLLSPTTSVNDIQNNLLTCPIAIFKTEASYSNILWIGKQRNIVSLIFSETPIYAYQIWALKILIKHKFSQGVK